MTSVTKTSARWFLPCPKSCSNPYASRASGVRNVPFPMARLRRAARMMGITVSRFGGRSVTRENTFVLPFPSVSL